MDPTLASFLVPSVLLIVGGLTGSVGVEIIRTWREKQGTDLDNLSAFYSTWRIEMADIRQELADLRELVIALSDELTSLGGDPTRVRVELERQRRRPIPPV